MERRRLAGMKSAFLLHHRKIKKTKKFLKSEKKLQGQKLAHRFFENLSPKMILRNSKAENLKLKPLHF